MMSERSAKDVVAEMFERQRAGDDTALDDLVAADMINHAAGPQGRDGLERILTTIDDDLGPLTVEQHHLIGDGDLVAQHLTVHGTHRASTMPLLAGLAVSERPAAWTFIHTSGGSSTVSSSSTGRAATTWVYANSSSPSSSVRIRTRHPRAGVAPALSPAHGSATRCSIQTWR